MQDKTRWVSKAKGLVQSAAKTGGTAATHALKAGAKAGAKASAKSIAMGAKSLPAARDAAIKLDQKYDLRGRGKRFTAHPTTQRYLPITSWLPDYKRNDLSGDLTAGVIVAIMLIPQSMAYALLAGLPPQAGLYASMLPLILYSIFGTSRALAVGPVAIVSLMVASGLSRFSELGSAEFVAHAIVLALLSGIFLTLLGLLRIGFIVNFLSHPVIAGFVSAAALIIGFSQFKHLLGISIERTHLIPKILWSAVEQVGQINPVTLLIAVGALALLLRREQIAQALGKRGLSATYVTLLPKAMPLVAAVFGTLVVWLFGLDTAADVKIVKQIPPGLPSLTLPSFDLQLWRDLLPTAILISIVGFLESVSVAKSLAAKRRQKIVPNQELIGLGMANIGAAATGGYPVTGGFSRSVVNFNAGANTPLAAIITAILIAIVLLLLTPLLYYLPKAVLAAIIIVAVVTLVDLKSFFHAWKYAKVDGFSYLLTFLGVLAFGVEIGIVIGLAVSLGLHLWRSSIPHMAIVGRVNDSEHFRNVERHEVTTYDKLLLVRVDESLYFANTAYLEDQLLRHTADHPDIEHLVLICSAVNAIDASAVDTLENLIEELRDARVQLHLAEVKGPVMDRLKRSDLLRKIKPGQIFLSTHDAVAALN